MIVVASLHVDHGPTSVLRRSRPGLVIVNHSKAAGRQSHPHVRSVMAGQLCQVNQVSYVRSIMPCQLCPPGHARSTIASRACPVSHVASFVASQMRPSSHV